MTKTQPRSSLFILSTILVVLIVTGLFASWWGIKTQTEQNRTLKNIISEHKRLESEFITARNNLATAEKELTPIYEFMAKIEQYRNISRKLEVGTASAKKHIEQVLQTFRVTPGTFEISKDITYTYNKNNYIGRQLTFEVRGSYRDVGRAIAQIESSIPLLRIISFELKPDDETVNEQVTGKFQIVIISAANEADKPNTKK